MSEESEIEKQAKDRAHRHFEDFTSQCVYRQAFIDGARALLALVEKNTWPHTVRGKVVPVVELSVLRAAVEGKKE